MGLEIERKFLVTGEAWRAEAVAEEPMVQGYLPTRERCSVRIRVSGSRAFLNVKSATLGVTRQEFEYEIPLADAREMLELFCGDQRIDKTRYHVPSGPHLWEIDVFAGANAGLVIAEIELAHPDEAFVRPDWLGPEVSDDPRYYNTCLVGHPYRDWPAGEREWAARRGDV